MTKVYACLIGNWVCLDDDPECQVGDHQQSPNLWWKEGADIYSPWKRENENSLYDLDYLRINFLGKNYRIHPIFIQIVTE